MSAGEMVRGRGELGRMFDWVCMGCCPFDLEGEVSMVVLLNINKMSDC